MPAVRAVALAAVVARIAAVAAVAVAVRAATVAHIAVACIGASWPATAQTRTAQTRTVQAWTVQARTVQAWLRASLRAEIRHSPECCLSSYTHSSPPAGSQRGNTSSHPRIHLADSFAARHTIDPVEDSPRSAAPSGATSRATHESAPRNVEHASQPLCAMGFHWALAKMAWKEMGT